MNQTFSTLFLCVLFLCFTASCSVESTDAEVESAESSKTEKTSVDASLLTVHEWGTITTKHLSDGTPQGSLNRIEQTEVLPSFVHNFEPVQTQGKPERVLTKSPHVLGRPDVTMRLETPVIYFYPDDNYNNTEAFKVKVSFRGGIINEYYPDAVVKVSQDFDRINMKREAGVISEWNGDILNNYVKGTIDWLVTDLPKEATIPETEDSVWLAPRKVDANYVHTDSGESEKYIFYRGVAHLNALLQTRSSNSTVSILSPASLHWSKNAKVVIPQAWMVDINEKGELAYQVIEPIELYPDKPSSLIQSYSGFNSEQYNDENLISLKQSMKAALVTEGLFDKEADAMLATWRQSYFENTGQRIFYIVPKEWLDFHLPMTISTPHKLSRAFIGRIDLIE